MLKQPRLIVTNISLGLTFTALGHCYRLSYVVKMVMILKQNVQKGQILDDTYNDVNDNDDDDDKDYSNTTSTIYESNTTSNIWLGKKTVIFFSQ